MKKSMSECLDIFHRAADPLDIICPSVATVFGRISQVDISPFLTKLGKGYVQMVQGSKGGVNLVKQTIANCNRYADKYNISKLEVVNLG